jgi:hypothetical protein
MTLESMDPDPDNVDGVAATADIAGEVKPQSEGGIIETSALAVRAFLAPEAKG